MKTLTIAGSALFAMVSAATATTLPPQPERPAANVSLMPILPAPAAIRSERAYFQAPEVPSDWASCRPVFRTLSSDWPKAPLCD